MRDEQTDYVYLGGSLKNADGNWDWAIYTLSPDFQQGKTTETILNRLVYKCEEECTTTRKCTTKEVCTEDNDRRRRLDQTCKDVTTCEDVVNCVEVQGKDSDTNHSLLSHLAHHRKDNGKELLFGLAESRHHAASGGPMEEAFVFVLPLNGNGDIGGKEL